MSRAVACLFVLWIGYVLTTCGGNKKKETPKPLFEGMDRRTTLRMKLYLVNGHKLYQTQCMGCHGTDGQGLKALVPPLAQAKILQRPDSVACVIKQGVQKGIRYVMPAYPHLTHLQIAEIMTYIGAAWGNRTGFQPVKQVQTYLKNCPKQQRVP